MSEQQNPKYVEAQKRGKADYSAIPWQAIHGLVLAMMEGMDKYGRFNFLEDSIEARTYIGAIGRHLFGDPANGTLGWVNGEDIDSESGLHHLDKVMACCLLVRAAEMHGKLIDNRLSTESKTPPSMRSVPLKVSIDTPHPPTMAEIRDLESGGDCIGGPFDAVFTVYAEDGSRQSEQRRGPYLSVEQAENYALRNPENLPGLRSISVSHNKAREDNA